MEENTSASVSKTGLPGYIMCDTAFFSSQLSFRWNPGKIPGAALRRRIQWNLSTEGIMWWGMCVPVRRSYYLPDVLTVYMHTWAPLVVFGTKWWMPLVCYDMEMRNNSNHVVTYIITHFRIKQVVKVIIRVSQIQDKRGCCFYYNPHFPTFHTVNLWILSLTH